MSTPVDLFDYDLPAEYIAQEPMEPRDHSKLMVLGSKSGSIEHRQFDEIVNYLHAGDVLVFNDTRVFKARLKGKVTKVTDVTKAAEVEVFLLRAHGKVWEALIRPGRKVDVGDVIDLGGLSTALKEKEKQGIVLLEFEVEPTEVLRFCDEHGSVPTPPYVKQVPDDLTTYQTVYARETGSVAAPTAGFHFTDRLLDRLRNHGVQIEFVTLHVGIGTFQPVKTETLEEHEMHAEFVEIDQGTADRINRAKDEGRRVVAVGTTTTRALEGVARRTSHVASDENDERLATSALRAYTGDVNIFITPGYEFKIVDALITNFHLPKSTLLALVSALAGRDHIMAAYEQAKNNDYRFYSFGDAMFIS
ncbi:MAG: tRNA preQ1(34) S-adenosylmethionine ribosyltransferase-isomerase QueA [Candidatus Uhrbacteria bacterium]|nr:tRNA preQ1(34) S-adenosylmethionine ribosyltransferase-isomerase QueA [Patescibacteria group bacterium]MBU1906692.1 tRNA preQ1(34) S-adenosylmethionine ribosyltransferase-isomerase QueA [Patescibacteria group bacterium]